MNRLWQEVRARRLDTILVWKFDRFARSTRQLINAVEEVRHLGVDGISITGQIDGSSIMGKAMFTVISAVAEMERSLISERLRAGIAKARANGKRHELPNPDERFLQEIQPLHGQGQGLHQIAYRFEITHQTVKNYTPRPNHKVRLQLSQYRDSCDIVQLSGGSDEEGRGVLATS